MVGMNLSGKGAAYGGIGGAVVGAGIGYAATGKGKKAGANTAIGAVAVAALGALGGAMLLFKSSSVGPTNPPPNNNGGGGGGGYTVPVDTEPVVTGPTGGVVGVPRHLQGVGLPQLSPFRPRAAAIFGRRM